MVQVLQKYPISAGIVLGVITPLSISILFHSHFVCIAFFFLSLKINFYINVTIMAVLLAVCAGVYCGFGFADGR